MRILNCARFSIRIRDLERFSTFQVISGRSSSFASANVHDGGPANITVVVHHRFQTTDGGAPPKIPIPHLAAASIQRWLSSHSLRSYPKSHWPGAFVAYLNCVMLGAMSCFAQRAFVWSLMCTVVFFQFLVCCSLVCESGMRKNISEAI